LKAQRRTYFSTEGDMPDSTGRFRGIFIAKDLPWHIEAFSDDHENTRISDPVYVDQSGNYVNEDGEPLNERDWE
jgi:hypothetical protein